MIHPLGYLNLAEELLKSSPVDEIKIRTAVNRAYYAVYLYAADKYCKAKGGDPSIEAMITGHSRFIKELKDEPNLTLKKLGNQLSDLKQDREKADYKYKIDISKPSAIKTCTQAQKIKQAIDSAFGNSK